MTSQPATPAQIPRATLASIVGERIRANITDGTLKPGSQLNEGELAATFGVSRGPIREALQRLVQEGLLRSEPHRGVFVPVMSDDDIVDIYVAREALESAAIRRIVGSAKSAGTYKALDRLVRAMEKAEANGNWDAVANYDLDFHTALVAAAGSPRLERMFSTVMSETRLCLSVLSGAETRRHDLVSEHRAINEMIREGDMPGALSVLRKHYDGGVTTLQSRNALWQGASTVQGR